jgi:hypothetical protein
MLDASPSGITCIKCVLITGEDALDSVRQEWRETVTIVSILVAHFSYALTTISMLCNMHNNISNKVTICHMLTSMLSHVYAYIICTV